MVAGDPEFVPEDHVWFVYSKLDGAPAPEAAAAWLELTGKTNMVMYGSSYPHWHMAETSDLPAGLTDAQRQKVLWQNANELYGLGLRVEAPA